MGRGVGSAFDKNPNKIIASAKGRPFGYWRFHHKENGDRSPRREDHLVLAYRCFNLRPYQPTVRIIKNIIEILAHSERVGTGWGDGVTLDMAGPKGSVMSPEAGFVSPYWPSVSGSVTVLPETETRLVQSTQAPLMLFKY